MKPSKEFCKENFNIKLVFNSFKIKNYFSYKDPIPDDLNSFLLCKFTCASCSSSYIAETCRHFKTRIEEHIKKDNQSHIFKHLHSTTTCFDSYNSLCFKIIDKANSKFDSKIKEALHINPSSFLSCFFFYLFTFFFHLLFSFPLTLISIVYCLNYTSLLLHLVTTHLLSHLFFSSVVFIISMVIVGIIYCLNNISLLLHLIITHLVIDFIITIITMIINRCPRQLLCFI